jgi:DNA-binding transcriptional LysR family regulator
MIQIHRLEGFYWVAKTKGYASAARAFPYPITQPAVHQQVKKLETELGMLLFERINKNNLKLTAAGRALYNFAAPFYERMPSVVRAIKSGEVAGELVIHAETLLVRQLLPDWVKRVLKKRPGARLDLNEMRNPNVRDLQNGDADVLLCHLPEVPDDVAAVMVAKLRPYLVVPTQHPISSRSRFSIRDFAEETFIAYHRDMLPQAMQMEALRSFGIQPERVLRAGSADSILAFVEAGLGYSLVPSLLPDGPTTKGVTARRITRPKVEFPVHLAWRKDMPENALFETFLETAPGSKRPATRRPASK